MNKKSNKRYLEDLWFIMHHSEDQTKKPLAVACYLDESGTDKNNQFAVVAGLILNRPGFLSFDQYWTDFLFRYGIDPPFHMKEFGRHGRFGHFSERDKSAIFTEITNIINNHKVKSVAAVLDKNQFETFVHINVRKAMGFYGLCFILCVHISHLYANSQSYKDNIAFLLDDGNEHKGHILDARNAMLQLQKTEPLHIGSITFGDDRHISALQAANVIAWGVRKCAHDISYLISCKNSLLSGPINLS